MRVPCSVIGSHLSPAKTHPWGRTGEECKRKLEGGRKKHKGGGGGVWGQTLRAERQMHFVEMTLPFRSANVPLAKGQTAGYLRVQLPGYQIPPPRSLLEVAAKNRRGKSRSPSFSLGPDFTVSSLYFSPGTLRPPLQVGWVVGVGSSARVSQDCT